MTREEAEDGGMTSQEQVIMTLVKMRDEMETAQNQKGENTDNWMVYALRVHALNMAILAMNSAGETDMVKTLKQACPYCSWIDPERLEDDPEDGAQNFCRVCGRDLRR